MPLIKANFTAMDAMAAQMGTSVQTIEADVENFVRSTLTAIEHWPDDGGETFQRVSDYFTRGLRTETEAVLTALQHAMMEMNAHMQGAVSQVKGTILAV